jgi:hypothetical protein
VNTILVDCAGVRSADEFWQLYLDAAKPEGATLFGRNLDAFWDAIEGAGPGWPGEAKLIFANSADLEPSLLDGLRRIAGEASHSRIELI